MEIHCGGFLAQRNRRVEQENRAGCVSVGVIEQKDDLFKEKTFGHPQ